MKKKGSNRRAERQRARKLAARQGRQLTDVEKAALENAFLDPHISGITSTEPKLNVVQSQREADELQGWAGRAYARGEIVIKVSISTRKTRKKFAIRG